MKNKKLLIIPTLLIMITSIIILIPKTKAEPIKIETDTTINGITKNLEGKIYAKDTEIILEESPNYYYIEYKKVDGTSLYSTSTWESFEIGRNGSYDVSAEEDIHYWKFEEITIKPAPTMQNAYDYNIVFTPVVIPNSSDETSPEYSISCDDKTVQKGKETTCHFNAQGIQLRKDDIKFDLNSTDFEIKNVEPSEYFEKVKLALPNIQLRTNYFDTDKSDIEIISFDIKAIKDKSNPDNINVTNIQYRENTYSKPVKTTVNILNKIIKVNPKTQRNIIIGAILVIATITSTILVVNKKKKNV